MHFPPFVAQQKHPKDEIERLIDRRHRCLRLRGPLLEH